MRKSACRLLAGLFLGCVAHLALAQTGAVQNHCYLGGQQALLSGMQSTNYQNGIVPACTVTVYLTGTQTKATIYADGSNTPLGNPFTANVAGSLDPGGWIFWAATNQALDVVLSGGGSNPSCTTAPNCYTQPITLTDVYPSSQFAVINPLTLQTDSVNNTSQTLLNFTDTNGVTWSNPSGGIEEVNVNIQALGGPPTYNSHCDNAVAVNTVTCTIASVTKGDILLLLGDVNNYGTSQPTAPTVSDSQSNLYTIDQSQGNPYFGTGSAQVAAHVFAGANGSITFQVANAGCATCTSRIVVMDIHGLGVDVGALAPPCAIACSTLSPSVAATAGNDVAMVLDFSPLGVATASPGSPLFTAGPTGGSYFDGWQFSALNPGTASTSNIALNGGSNFPAAAIWLIKSSLQYNPGSGTVNLGGGNSLAMYPAATSNNVYPSGLISDSAGDLQIPSSVAPKVSTVASSGAPTVATPVVHVTGTSQMLHLAPPATCDATNYGCLVVVIPNGNCSFSGSTPAGNNTIGFNGACTPGQPLLMVYDQGTQLWLPIYQVGALQTTVTGTTAGTAVWSQPQQTVTWKQAVVYLSGYENTTGTAQTITLPASFATVGYVITDGGTCTGVTISGATVTLPASMVATQTGLCEIKGY